MDNRGYVPRSVGLSRENKRTNSRRIHPVDDEVESISPDSYDQNSPINSVS